MVLDSGSLFYDHDFHMISTLPLILSRNLAFFLGLVLSSYSTFSSFALIPLTSSFLFEDSPSIGWTLLESKDLVSSVHSTP